MNVRRLLACLNISVFDAAAERPLHSAAEKKPRVFIDLSAGIILACAAVLLWRHDAAAGTVLICLTTLAGTAGVLFPPKLFSRFFCLTALFALPVWETANAVCAVASNPFFPPSAMPAVTVMVQAAALIAVLWRDMDFKEKILAVFLFLTLAAATRFSGTDFAELAVVFSIAFFTDAAAAGRAAQILFGILFFSALLTMQLSADAAAGLSLATGILFKGTAIRLKGRQ